MALWNINNTYLQVAYNFAHYFIQTYNNNPYNLWPVFLSETMLSHNDIEIKGPTEVLNYLVFSNIKNIEIPTNGISVQPSFQGSILINLYGTYQSTGICSLSGILRNIIISMVIIPDNNGNYYLLNLIIKTKERGEALTFHNMKF